MVATVGHGSTIEKRVQNLPTLEQDAISADPTTINRLDDPISKAKIAEFERDQETPVPSSQECLAPSA